MIISKNNTLLEGEQAEAYKKRKAEEKEKAKEMKPRHTGDTFMKPGEGYKSGTFGAMKENRPKNMGRRALAFQKAQTAVLDRYEGDKTNMSIKDAKELDKKAEVVTDAIDRHERRHPKKESTIFDNIIFDEFTLLEGEQAEAYKKRKADEKAVKEKEYNERNERRYIGQTFGWKSGSHPNPSEEMIEKDGKRLYKSMDIEEKEWNNRKKTGKNIENYSGAKPGEIEARMDAIDRHLRKEEKKNK